MLSVTALIAALPARAVEAAPHALANSIAHASTSSAAISATTATLVKGTLTMIAWTKFKFAAGLAALLILVAGTATIAAQKVAQSKRDAASEARRSTPIGALRYLLDAFASYDGEKILDSHDTNAPAIRLMVLAITNAVTAEGRLRKELEEKFQSTGGMGQGPAVQMGFGQEHLDSAVETITGNTATVTIPDRPGETQDFIRIGNVWKITDPGGGRILQTSNQLRGSSIKPRAPTTRLRMLFNAAAFKAQPKLRKLSAPRCLRILETDKRLPAGYGDEASAPTSLLEHRVNAAACQSQHR